MDYEELLKKYIQHVVECEGTDFIYCLDGHQSDVEFTEEERVVLEQISAARHE